MLKVLFCVSVLLVITYGAIVRDVEEHHHQAETLDSVRAPIFDEIERTPEFWINGAQNLLLEKLKPLNTNKAKNVILFLGDGMGVSTVAAARHLIGGEAAKLSFDKFPNTGFSRTYCLNSQVSDSASTSTAYLTGVKAMGWTIGVNGNVPPSDCLASNVEENKSFSIAKWAQDAGKATGLVTTTRVTHASPAGVYAHVASRDWENDNGVSGSGCDPEVTRDIAHQLLYSETGARLNVVLGGGRREFLANDIPDHTGTFGYRTDGRNLLEEWSNARENSAIVFDKPSLLDVDYENTDYLLGLFGSSHNEYNLDNIANGDLDLNPSLVEMTKAAVDILSKEENGFFLFVEGGKIDQGHHSANTRKALDETVEFHKAIEYVRERFSEDDTLIVVTADHSHVLTMAGYADRGADIFGFGGNGQDGLPYMTLSYANGPGYVVHTDPNGGRIDPRTLDTTDRNFVFPGTVPLSDESHAGEDVGVWASGPWSHLFSGNYEQSFIPHAMNFAACIGNGATACA